MTPALFLDGTIFLCVVCAILGILPYVWQPRPRITGLSKPAIPVESAGRSRLFVASLSLVGSMLAGAGARVEGLRRKLAYVGSRLAVEEFAGIKVLAVDLSGL